ncbi:hypothetical protein J1N35_016281 [Gossypium stocksii]|uniref:Uncharacterized protein n=1 Tax=Gossypium stocksii TaxID=47602 RepID=A0A9D3VKB4_9ROSI|nr:hypothetical protein J1N35_016281 [Gossypium stocksii]
MASEKEAVLAAAPSDSPTIFDKIINMEIPATVVYENEKQGTLGSKPAAQLLEKPSYWFSANLHCKFTALVEHEEGGDTPASLPQKGKKFSIYLVPLSFDDVIVSGM